MDITCSECGRTGIKSAAGLAHHLAKHQKDRLEKKQGFTNIFKAKITRLLENNGRNEKNKTTIRRNRRKQNATT